MFRRTLIFSAALVALAAAAALINHSPPFEPAFIAPAQAQVGGVPYFPQVLPAGTVVGRLPGSPGPAEAIPFATLTAQLLAGTPWPVSEGGTGCTAASGTCLDNILGLATTGLVTRTGAGAYATTPPMIAYGGRLTLQSGHPIQNADQTGVSAVYYTPCAGAVPGCSGNRVPMLDASGNVTMVQFTSSPTDTVGQSLQLNASQELSGNLYDIYEGLVSGVPGLGAGPAWSSSAAGASSRGATAAIVLVNGVWVNNLSMTMMMNGAFFTCPAQQCTWLGTMYATANGQTSMTLKPAAVSGGANNFIGLCNAANRRRLFAKNQDSRSTWNVQVDPPGQLVDASNTTGHGANNRISFVDCTGVQEFTATIRESGAPGDANANALTVGIAMDGTSGFTACAGAGCRLDQLAANNTSTGGAAQGQFSPYPVLGFRFAQAMEESESTHAFAIFGDDFEMLSLEIEE